MQQLSVDNDKEFNSKEIYKHEVFKVLGNMSSWVVPMKKE